MFSNTETYLIKSVSILFKLFEVVIVSNLEFSISIILDASFKSILSINSLYSALSSSVNWKILDIFIV